MEEGEELLCCAFFLASVPSDVLCQDLLSGRQGWTALLKASEKGHTEIVKLLLEHNATVDIADKCGREKTELGKERAGDGGDNGEDEEGGPCWKTY